MGIEAFDVREKAPTHVVIEMFGGDNNLSPFVAEDLEEARRGIQGKFAMLALADRTARGAEIIEISGGRRTRVRAVGEIDTGDPTVLRDFLASALLTYASVPHVAIGFWDHGSGVFDEHDDDEVILRRRPLHARPARRLLTPPALRRGTFGGPKRAMLHDDTGGLLTTREAGAMLASAFDRAKRKKKVDVLFSDTCLNGMLEVTHELSGVSDIVVASEELEPGDGWDYFQLFRLMGEKPPATAEAWAKQMIAAFGLGYESRPDMHPCTLAAFKTKSTMLEAFALLVKELRAAGREGYRAALEARMSTQSFTGAERYDTFDLHHFAERLAAASGSRKIDAACKAVQKAVVEARVAEIHFGDDMENATGIAFWFPTGSGSFKKDRRTYDDLSCSKKTGWTEYLASMMK